MSARDEAARLAALRRYRILDTEPEQRFDDLALLASHICGTPMALITLVDEHRQWFKARQDMKNRLAEMERLRAVTNAVPASAAGSTNTPIATP